MEKGLKNLNQAYRSAQKKQGTYDGNHDDSGIGHSDMDEDDRRPDVLESVAENPFQQHYPTVTQQRMPSINNIIDHPYQPQPGNWSR